jgi:hypothetical protein
MSVKKASSSLVSRSRVGFTPTGGGAAVTISNVIVTDSNWNNLDDTAVGTSSSYIKIIGSGFVVNPSVYVGTTQVSSGNITFVSSTELRVVLPSLSLGTQNLFVFNTDYSGAIWSAGLVVSGFPDFTQTTYTSSTPLSVSVQLVATGDAPLTYALQGGSSLPAGTTLSSSGLITGTTTDGTYQFTVIVSDAQNQSFQQQLTLTITSTDQYFNITPLAINGDVNTFVSDASTNSFPITINGDTKPSKFSPYNTNWSVYIDGTDYLEVTQNASLAFQGGGAWTWESFVYPITGGIVYASYTGPSNSGGSFIFSVGTTIGFSWILNGTDTWSFDSGGTSSTANSVPLNAWSHCAVSYDGAGSLKFFVNGTLNATFSRTVNVDTLVYNIRVGRSMHPDYPSQFGGYLSNMRFVKGTALYTSSFTAPTSALTAVANTVFLGFTSNRMTYDASSVNNTITPFNTPQTTSFGPFTETDTTTGSTYFDGTGDYLTIPDSESFDLPGDFTVEFFAYATGSNARRWFQLGDYRAGQNGILIYSTSGNAIVVYVNGAVIITGPTLVPYQWVYIACVREGAGSNNLKLYVNGSLAGQVTNTLSFVGVTGNGISLGAEYGGSFAATLETYMSDFRLVKGTAVYTAAFTPPTAPLTAVSGTQLLTLQNRQPVNNHTFIDTSGNNIAVTRTGNVTQGSFSPFSPAGWSNYFDGSGDSLTAPAGSAFAYGTGDFTIEGWFYQLTALAYGATLYAQTVSGTNYILITAGANSATPANNLVFHFNTSGAATFLTSTNQFQLNQWNHFAVVRQSGVAYLYINGVANGSAACTQDFSNTTYNPTIGTYSHSGIQYFTGYISNFRIVKGTALYTSNFTPSTASLTAITNTSLLTCQSNRFIDNSTNNFTITKNGDVKVFNFSPFKPTAAYSPVTHGGSAYFDGSSKLTTSSNIDISGIFTIEGWIYSTNAGGWLFTIGNFPVYINVDTGVVTLDKSSVGTQLATTANDQVKGSYSWKHLAITRDSAGLIRVFMNGVLLGSVSTSYSAGTLNGLGQYATYGGAWQGYISDFRVLVGTALYTSAFTPPTAPLVSISNTSFLLNLNNPAIVDISSRNVLETVGDAKIVTSTRKYGTGSLVFDGTGDYLAILNNNLLQFGTGNFTVEFWLNATNTGGTHGLVAASSTGTGYWASLIFQNSIYWQSVNGTTNLFSASYSSYYGSWTHVAFCRNNSVTKLYLNGIEVASASDTNNYNGTAGTYDVGRDLDNNGLLTGYIDDLRITRFARYTANFTPPTSTFLVQ